MLACRPMLSFAAAVMAGLLLARFFPDSQGLLWLGWPVFLGLALCFLAWPGDSGADAASLPAGYARHILARPGFSARRGMNGFILLLCLLFFLLGATRQYLWQERRDSARLPDRQWFDATLLALSPSRQHPEEVGAWRIPALLLTADGANAGSVPVRLNGRKGESFRRGDIVAARVRVATVSPRAYPGAFDYAFWLERDGLTGTLDIAAPRRGVKGVSSYQVIPVDSPTLSISVRRALDAIRSRAISLTLQYGGAEGPMLAAMIYGYRKDMSEDLRDAFRRVGIGHVLAISGLHVGLIVGLLWWLCGLTGWRLRWRALACLFLALVYLGLSGGQVAAARATAMAVIHLGAIAWGRKSDMLNSLGAAAFIIAFLNPTAPLDVSFQLSFTAVVFIYMALRRRPDAEATVIARPVGDAVSWQRRAVRWLLSLVRLSIATWVGLYPIIAMVFNQVNLVGLPINIVVIPLMSLVLGGGLLLPWLGWIPGMAWLLTRPGHWLTAIAMWSDRLPGSSFPAHAPSWKWVLTFYLLVFFFLLRGVLAPGWFRLWWGRGMAVGLAVSLVGITASMRSVPPPAGGRIAVLPARGAGVLVVESAGGQIAVIGSLQRGGLNEAGWLHSLKRGGNVAVVAVGKRTRKNAAPLAYHYSISDFTAIPITVPNWAGRRTGWRAVPGAHEVEYALARDDKGMVIWLAARTGGKSAAIAPYIGMERFAGLLNDKAPGYDADLISLGFAGNKPMLPPPALPEGMVAVRGRYGGGLPAGWFERRNFGVLRVYEGVAGYDGECWVEMEQP